VAAERDGGRGRLRSHADSLPVKIIAALFFAALLTGAAHAQTVLTIKAAPIGDPQVIPDSSYVPSGYMLAFNSEFPNLNGISTANNGAYSSSYWWYHWTGTQCCMDFSTDPSQNGAMYATGSVWPYAVDASGGVDLNLTCPSCNMTAWTWYSAISQSLAQCDSTTSCVGNGGFSQQYGYFEMSAKLPSASGMWPAFWLRPVDATTNVGEIDIMEAYTQYQGGYCATMTNWAGVNGGNPGDYAQGCFGNSPHNATAPGGSTPGLPYPHTISDGYHVYSLLWTSTSAVFAVDGNTQITVDLTQPWVGTAFNGPYYILWDLGIGGGGQNISTPPSSPQTMAVKYIRVYH
jgi:hypothetical protein